MARTARCPYCGASVEFKSVVSVLAVCDYCRGTLLRKGEDFEGLGRMAELMEDRSPLQRGAEGRWQSRQFALIGRIQLKYEHGLWSEWHLLFDDGKSGWLSEAGGEYVLSQPRGVRSDLPAFDDTQVGQVLTIEGRSFTITNRLVADCIAGEGELPFKIGAGYPAPLIDLRDEQGGFATLDYSDDPARPLLYLGAPVEFSSLAWANLRDAYLSTPATETVRAFSCPNCGAPFRVAHDDIVSVGCTGCGALLDTASEEVQLIARVDAQIRKPRLPLGSRGTLRGETVEIIGYLRRSMRADGVEYAWDEYVCLGKDNALVWLTEYNGHWNIGRTLSRSVAATHERAVIGKQVFRHFQSYAARVKFVIGEFPWRVTVDETVQLHDYVAPPQMLSAESTESETTWTLADYAEAGEIAAAFGLGNGLPAAQGVFANQPNPHEVSHRSVCRRFWLFAVLAVFIYVALQFTGNWRIFVREPLTFSPADDEPKFTREFRLEGITPRLEIAQDTNLANNWIGFNMTLVNKDSGESWQTNREVSRYEGIDDGEKWSEGSRTDAVVFRDLPPGTYLLAIEADMDDRSPPVTTHLQIQRTGPRESSLLLVLIFLVLFPVFTRLRRGSFEVRRWADSDHPIVKTSEGGGDGDGGDD